MGCSKILKSKKSHFLLILSQKFKFWNYFKLNDFNITNSTQAYLSENPKSGVGCQEISEKN